MALAKTGGGIVDIRGSIAGNYFHRDKSGLHCCRQPRSIHRRSSAQNTQRKAFAAARAYSTDPRFVSYNIYRVLNGLAPKDPPTDYHPNMK